MDLISKLKKECEEVGERLIRLNDFLSKGQTVSDTQRALLLAQASSHAHKCGWLKANILIAWQVLIAD
ncbi:hypothetical protein PO252_07125 [Limosilactobacillus mucosae]|uniref:hypothetical protein n=1 Tax=Limosilactobacillus mucosae TaxID=97478 RepID=UPI00233F3369|nr:hypothetical protein [Limosilactobacillus mucosae]MDC2839595.1 hypothetical protein [Limosilactobacillus mucosae]